MNIDQIFSKVWGFCRILRDDGVSCVDYIEQLTTLLFLKIADEYSKPPYNKKIGIPKSFSWQSLTTRQGTALENHYTRLLKSLGNFPGLLGQIFDKLQNKIQDPIKLAKIIALINENIWSMAGTNLTGDLYERFINKMAEDTQKGAGQYFTPRALIQVIIECVNPLPNKTIADPACGTGGFLLGAYQFISKHYKLDQQTKKILQKSFSGNEIVTSTRRLCLMNLFLQGIGNMARKSVPISSQDAIIKPPLKKVDYVFANPPFGRKSSIKVTTQKGNLKKEACYTRFDFWVTTSNKQLSFLQHIKTLLKPMGQAAVIVPDNTLFEAGAGETIRRKLLETTNLHTILRLPAGVFALQSIKTNVLFFDNKPSSRKPCTKTVWVYDYRTNIHHSYKKNPFRPECLADFIKCYRAKNRETCQETWSAVNPHGRWRKFSYQEIISRDKYNLDIFWLKDNTVMDFTKLPNPQKIVEEVIGGLETTLGGFSEILKELKDVNAVIEK